MRARLFIFWQLGINLMSFYLWLILDSHLHYKTVPKFRNEYPRPCHSTAKIQNLIDLMSLGKAIVMLKSGHCWMGEIRE